MQKLADSLLGPECADVDLSLAGQAIANGADHELLTAILDVVSDGGFDAVASLERTMALLEAIIDRNVVVGGSLMARLYERASEARLHHVCDAIELWMNHVRSKALASQLRAMGASAEDGGRSRYSRWARLVDN